MEGVRVSKRADDINKAMQEMKVNTGLGPQKPRHLPYPTEKELSFIIRSCMHICSCKVALTTCI